MKMSSTLLPIHGGTYVRTCIHTFTHAYIHAYIRTIIQTYLVPSACALYAVCCRRTGAVGLLGSLTLPLRRGSNVVPFRVFYVLNGKGI